MYDIVLRMRHKFFGQHSIISIMDQWSPSGPYTRPLEIVLNITLMSTLKQNKRFLVVNMAATPSSSSKLGETFMVS